MDDNDLPNLLIIGAPKCGTTSVFRWLAEHPQVCASKRKETWFFAGEELDYLGVRPNHQSDDLQSYLDCFDEVTGLTRVRLEGSTHYLYSDKAIDFFSALDPQPKLIVLLRDPALRIWSHFNYIRHRSKKPVEMTFSEYVDRLLDAETAADPVPTVEQWPRYLLKQQLSYSSYYRHIARWLDRFPRERIYVVALEDLRGRKMEVAQELAEWAEIDGSFYDDYEFATANARRSRGAEGVRRRLARLSKFFPRIVVHKVRSILDRILASRRPGRNADDQRAIDQLTAHFASANSVLRDELKVDISGWQGTH